MLLTGGYIATVRTPDGFKYTLLKSKKWQKQARREFPKLPISSQENAQIGHREVPFGAQRSPAAGILIKTIQGQHKEEAVEEAASAVFLKEKNGSVQESVT
jgi:hypothetical protein